MGGRCAGAVFSVFVLVMRGRRPRGAWGTVSGAASAFTAAGSAMAAVCCISVAGTSFFRPRPLFSLFSAGAPSEAENPAIFSISSRFFNVVSPIPIAFAISRSSTRLFPSNLLAKIVHYFEIQNKKLQITPFRRGFHHKLGVPGRKILIYGDCTTRKLPPPLYPEQQIYSAIALFVLLMFVCAKTTREAREVFLRCRSGVLPGRVPAAGASGGYSLRRRFHLLLLQITALTRSSP